jgi:hypothetical protein
VYLFKAIKLNDSQISIVSNDRITRRATINSVTLKISRVNTLTFQNSFYNRAPRIYNSLPPQIQEASVTVGQFKSYLLTYYEAMTKQIYNITTHFTDMCVPHFFLASEWRSTQAWLQNLAPFQVFNNTSVIQDKILTIYIDLY